MNSVKNKKFSKLSSISSKRILLIALGVIASGLGIVGVWLPGMPTTIFILIALWAFSQSSDRLHAWLLRVPVLKHAVTEARRFQREGTVDRRAKFISQACAWVSFIAVTITLRSVVLSIIVGLLALSCSVFMYLVPTAKRAPGKAGS